MSRSYFPAPALMDKPASESLQGCGRRLLPVLIDEIAKASPEKPFISIARTSDPQDGFQDIGFGTFARAIDRCSWWIEDNLGRSTDFETLFTYLPAQDLRHAILVLAAIKTGYKMFFSSPSNSIDDHLALLDITRCRSFLKPRLNSAVTEEILSRRPMRTRELPDLEYWLQAEETAVYPYQRTYIEACHEPFVVLHSSGTTGTPKLLVLKHGTYTPLDAYQRFPSLGEKPWSAHVWRGKRIFTSFPWFHASGLPFLLHIAIYNDFVGVILPSVQKITGAIADSVHLHGNVEASYLAPSILVELSRNKVFLENLQRLKFISYVGGPLPQGTGDSVSTRTKLSSWFGSTEVGYLPTEIPDGAEDWAYLKYSPFLNHELRHFADDLHELFIVRGKGRECFQGIFFTFPDLDEYSMKDLYVRHPSRVGWWRHAGRTDDVIVFTDARKLNPVLMESFIESHPAVASAIICGYARPQPALLIEPVTYPASTEEKESLLQDIWPAVEQAMRDGPATGRLVKPLVLFTVVDKPMMRAGGKGTVQRKKTVASYHLELDLAYNALAEAVQKMCH